MICETAYERQLFHGVVLKQTVANVPRPAIHQSFLAALQELMSHTLSQRPDMSAAP